MTKEKAKALIMGDFVGKRVILGIRPNQISLVKQTKENDCHVKGLVDVYEMLGTEAIVYINAVDTKEKLVANIKVQETLKPKDEVGLIFQTECIHIFDTATGNTITN